jgi:hypothetical protein
MPRNRIEIMFGRLKDWRYVATRYDRCLTDSFSAVALAATVIPDSDQGVLTLTDLESGGKFGLIVPF